MFVMLHNVAEHNHNNTKTERSGMESIVKKYINGYGKLKLKPSATLKVLRNGPVVLIKFSCKKLFCCFGNN